MPTAPEFGRSVLRQNAAILLVYVCAFLVAVLFFLSIRASRPNTCRFLFRKHPVLFLAPLLLLNVTWLMAGDYPFTEFLGIPFLNFSFTNFTFSITGLLLISLVLTPLAITIHVMLTHAAVHGGLVSTGAIFREWSRRFVTILLVYFVGTFGLLLLLGMVLLLAQVLGMVLALLLMGILGVVINVLTCMWYAAVVENRAGFWRGLKEAIAFGKAHFCSVFAAVAAHLLLSGFVIFYSVTVTSESSSKPAAKVESPSSIFSSGGSSYEIRQKNNFKIDVFWVLGMEEKCRWYNEVASAAEEKKSPVISYLLETLMILISAFFISKYSHLYLTRKQREIP